MVFATYKQTMPSLRDPPLIGIVGVCASGKTTLIYNLARLGYVCRHIAQEHSYVADMWKRLTNPDVLIYLEASYEVTVKRKKLNWTVAEYMEQVHRLRHARAGADVIIDTDQMNSEEVTLFVKDKIEFIVASRKRLLS